MHRRKVALVDDALTAKAQPAARHHSHLGPLLAQPGHQQLQGGRCMFGPIDAARTQVGAQQLLAAEHIQSPFSTDRLGVPSARRQQFIGANQRIESIKIQHAILPWQRGLVLVQAGVVALQGVDHGTCGAAGEDGDSESA